MPIKERNNDQNISRLRTKMSEGCSSQKNKPKLTGTVTEKLNNLHKNSSKHNLNYSYAHLYPHTSKTLKKANNSIVKSQKSNSQNCESEVRFLEEWLLLHLDLIQQQNDEIVSKERTIYILQQENEMLREHLNCLQGEITYSPETTFNNYSYSDMTQDATHIEDDKRLIYDCATHQDTMNNYIKSCGKFNNILSYNDSIVNRTRVQAPCDIDSEVAANINTDDKSLYSHSSIMKRNKNNIVVNNYQDTLKNFEMSIKRKRLCSGSSAFSNNTSIEEPHPTGKRRRKHSTIKDEKILTSNEQYVTQANETGILNDPDHGEISSTSNLEVPRWRVRVYTSLYSMEGTENLDDDVFNRRHMRLENDERRRKRWDVQRIREQRVVDKLKLRQERISGSHSNDKAKLASLWPTLEDVKFIEVCDELPVSAFGAPVPRLAPSEFSLPWLVNSAEPKLEVLEIEHPLPQPEQLPVKGNRTNRKPKKRRKASKR